MTNTKTTPKRRASQVNEIAVDLSADERATMISGATKELSIDYNLPDAAAAMAKTMKADETKIRKLAAETSKQTGKTRIVDIETGKLVAEGGMLDQIASKGKLTADELSAHLPTKPSVQQKLDRAERKARAQARPMVHIVEALINAKKHLVQTRVLAATGFGPAIEQLGILKATPHHSPLRRGDATTAMWKRIVRSSRQDDPAYLKPNLVGEARALKRRQDRELAERQATAKRAKAVRRSKSVAKRAVEAVQDMVSGEGTRFTALKAGA